MVRYPAIASAAATIGAQSPRMVMEPIFEKGFAAHGYGLTPRTGLQGCGG